MWQEEKTSITQAHNRSPVPSAEAREEQAVWLGNTWVKGPSPSSTPKTNLSLPYDTTRDLSSASAYEQASADCHSPPPHPEDAHTLTPRTCDNVTSHVKGRPCH